MWLTTRLTDLLNAIIWGNLFMKKIVMANYLLDDENNVCKSIADLLIPLPLKRAVGVGHYEDLIGIKLAAMEVVKQLDSENTLPAVAFLKEALAYEKARRN